MLFYFYFLLFFFLCDNSFIFASVLKNEGFVLKNEGFVLTCIKIKLGK